VETTTPRLLTFGDEPRHVDIRGWRYGPRRLRVNDDDDDDIGYLALYQLACLSIAVTFFPCTACELRSRCVVLSVCEVFHN